MTADTFTWVLSEIVSRFREHVGISDTGSLADATINKWINDYYQNNFPDECHVDLLHGEHTQSTSAVDNGEYSLSQAVLTLKKPVLCNGQGIETELELSLNKEQFFREHKESEQYVTTPSLAIGVSSAAAVKHSDFSYDIGGYAYNKSSSEVSLSGLSTVPKNTYGAFSLKIDSDGDITAAEADDNATGYDTPLKAIQGLGDADGNSAFMGYVTVISTAAFIPGTTELSAAAVTDTYTDGQPANRSRPETVCIYKGYLYVRPKANDIFRIRCPKVLRPDAIDEDGVPLDIKWGPAIACGAAILYAKIVMKDQAKVKELDPLHTYYMNQITGKDRKQLIERTVERSTF